MQITAVVIWREGHFLNQCTPPTPKVINVDRITEGARAAWLSNLSQCCGGEEGYKLTFSDPTILGSSHYDPNALSGIFVGVDNSGYFIDGLLSDFVTKANGCCGSNAAVTPIYNGTFPALILPLAKTFTVTRTDNGDFGAYEKFQVAYMKWIIDGTLNRTTYSGGVSTYVFSSYSDPNQQGSDTVTETARVFTSGTAPTLTGGNVFNVNGVVDNITYNLRTGATTLANAVVALQANGVTGPLGTWSVSGSTIVLTTKVHDYGTVVITQVA